MAPRCRKPTHEPRSVPDLCQSGACAAASYPPDSPKRAVELPIPSSPPRLALPGGVQPLDIAARHQRHRRLDRGIGQSTTASRAAARSGLRRTACAAPVPGCRRQSHRLDIARHQRTRADDRAVAHAHAGHDDRLAADPHIIADHRVSGGQIAVRRLRLLPALVRIEEGECAHPFMAVPLIAAMMNAAPEPIEQNAPMISRSASASGNTYRAQSSKPCRDNSPNNSCAADDDVGMRHLLIERDALERAFEEIGHDHGSNKRSPRQARSIEFKMRRKMHGQAAPPGNGSSAQPSESTNQIVHRAMIIAPR